MDYLRGGLTALFGLAFGCFFLQMGAHALVAQHRFLQFCNRWHRGGELEKIDAGYFGGPRNLRLLGVGLAAVGLFIVASVVVMVLIGLGYLA
ncbi:MAG TPA: hypothetical protein VFK81_06165 [Terriglobales bacterium]|jgi:hypothetical protein|nr:hypothetical protein [Terriglobales bacterium]